MNDLSRANNKAYNKKEQQRDDKQTNISFHRQLKLITVTFRCEFIVFGLVGIGAFVFTKVPLRMIFHHCFRLFHIELERRSIDRLKTKEKVFRSLLEDLPSHRHRNRNQIVKSPNKRSVLELSVQKISLRPEEKFSLKNED